MSGIFLFLSEVSSQTESSISHSRKKNEIDNVFIFQRNDFVFNSLLSTVLMENISAFFPMLHFGCPKGQEALNESSDAFEDVAPGLNNYSANSRWCVSKCTPPLCVRSGKVAVVKADPFRTTCIWINHGDGVQVGYKLSTPTIRDEFIYDSCADKLFGKGGLFDHEILDYIPKYAFYGIIGALLCFSAPDIAANPVFQYSVVAIAGVGIFLFWIMLSLYRVAEETAKRNFSFAAPLLPLVGPLLAMKIFYLGNSFSIFQEILTFMVNLWENGQFGFKYAGKVGIISSMVLSVGIVKWMRIFERKPLDDDLDEEEPTRAEVFLQLLIYALGLWFVCQSTPNVEISLLLLACALLWEPVKYTFYYNSIASDQVTTQRSRKPQMTVSQEEMTNVVSSRTQMELNKLRAQMTNPENSAQMSRLKHRQVDSDSGKRTDDFTREFLGGGKGVPDAPVKVSKLNQVLNFVLVICLLLLAFAAVWSQTKMV